MNWKHTFHMRDLLSDDTSDENSVRVAKELARRMKASNLFKDYDGESIIEDLESNVEDADYFNEVLDRFWDYCDANRIWISSDERGTWKPEEVAK